MTSPGGGPDGGPGSAEVDRNGLVVLDRDECLRLLRRCAFGRIAVTIGALPVILPVNFRLVGERIVLRTSPGSKLDAATVGAVVSFEVDEIDPVAHTGWSVMVTGVAAEVTDPEQLEEIAAANVPRWAHGAGPRVVEIPVTMVSGRVLAPGLGWDAVAPPVLGVALGLDAHLHRGPWA